MSNTPYLIAGTIALIMSFVFSFIMIYMFNTGYEDEGFTMLIFIMPLGIIGALSIWKWIVEFE